MSKRVQNVNLEIEKQQQGNQKPTKENSSDPYRDMLDFTEENPQLRDLNMFEWWFGYR